MPSRDAPPKKQNEKYDLRQNLADRLLEQIEAGTAPWQRPWERGEVQAPYNAVTGKPYRGVNREWLSLFSPDLSDNRWCTEKQAKEQGWKIKENDFGHGTPIERWTEYQHKLTDAEKQKLRDSGVEEGEISEEEKRLRVKYYDVYHASQIDGIPQVERAPRDHALDGTPDLRIEKLAEAMGVEVRRGGSRAFYRKSADLVQMPSASDLHTATGHDTTFLHELSHATSHESRLNRDIASTFGSQKYAVEELRAEMSAAMTAATLGIGFDPQAQEVEEGREVGNTAAYLGSWLRALPEKERKQAIVGAIRDARGISDYLIARTPDVQLDHGQELTPLSGKTVEYAWGVFRENVERNSVEIQFKEKPSEEVRTDLKDAGFWWNGKLSLWYRQWDGNAEEKVSAFLGKQAEIDEPGIGAGPEMAKAEKSPDAAPTVAPAEAQKPSLLTSVPRDLWAFMGAQQREVSNTLLRGEEGEFFSDKMRELAGIVQSMPVTYGTDGMPDAERPVSLRYFGPGNQQWFIIEKDRGNPLENDFLQTQAFGLADLGMGEPELGYINIEEITRLGAELDYHFTPTTLLEVKKQHYPELIREENTPQLETRGLDSAILAHLQERMQIRQGENRSIPGAGDGVAGKLPTGLAPDPVAAAELFTTRYAMRNPDEAKAWASELVKSVDRYSDASGFPPDRIRVIAHDLEWGANRMRFPEVGDLVRFAPHDPNPLHGEPFSGRIITRLSTNTGDFRYHLRAERGERQGIEAVVYGKDGKFRSIDLEQAIGFDRDAVEPLSPEQKASQPAKAIQEFADFHEGMHERVGKVLSEAWSRLDTIDPADVEAQRKEIQRYQKELADARGLGKHGMLSEPWLKLEDALGEEKMREDFPEKERALQIAVEVGIRVRNFEQEIRQRLKDRLIVKGKEVLSSGEGLSPQKMVAACYWKRGILAEETSAQVVDFVKDVENKNLPRMLSLIGNNSQNPGSEEAFTRLTGVALGKTQSARVAQLEGWAGPEKVQALQQAAMDREQKRAEEAPRTALRKAFDGLAGLRVNMGDKTVDGQAFVESAVGKGFTQVKNRKKGAVTERYLLNADTGKTMWLKGSTFQSYCKAVQGLEPSGDLAKAMEAAKIPLAVVPKGQAKEEKQIGVAPEPPRQHEEPEKKPLNAYEEKQQARRDRYRAAAERLASRARQKFEQARKMAEVIPFGQPILVGHHSENRDRRYRARIHDIAGAAFNMMDKADYYRNRAERMSAAIRSDDPEALEKLREKLDGLKKSQEMMKAANAVLRKSKSAEDRIAGLEKIGFSTEAAKKVLEPDHVGRVGFPPYALTNNNANIRRIEERVNGLEKKQTLEDRTGEYRWGTVRQNKENNRIQFLFDGKPDDAIRDLLKSNGFRWAPSEKAWQRQWTGNAAYSAKSVIKKLNEMMPPEQAEKAPERAPATAERAMAPTPAARSDLPESDGVNADLAAVVRGRDGRRYALSLVEKPDGMAARLDLGKGKILEAPLQPLHSGNVPDEPKIAARFQRENGDWVLARFSRGSAGVDADVLLPRQGLADQRGVPLSWEKTNDHPGRLRTQRPDASAARWVAAQLDVDAERLKPREIPSAHLSPKPRGDRSKGIER
ncbi:MAG: DUF3560 domain-containing protein [Acidithiobacillus sp.]